MSLSGLNLICVVLPLCLSCVLGFGADADTKSQSDIAAVRQLSAEETSAFEHQDIEKLASLWSDHLKVTNPLNKLVGKQDVLAMMRSGFLVITQYSREVEYAREYNGIVFLVGTERVRWAGRMPQAGKTQNLRFTALWMKEQGRWLEVLRHANIIPEQE